MPRKGQLLKTRQRAVVKPAGPQSVRHDPLAGKLMVRYMEEHFEWMLVTGYSPDTVRARRQAIRKFISWIDERGLDDVRQITRPMVERYQRHLYYYRKSNGDPLTVAAPSQPVSVQPNSLEVLLLCRAIAAQMNPQLVAQVRAKLALPQQ